MSGVGTTARSAERKCSAAAKSVFVFGLYLGALGAGILVSPKPVFDAIGVDAGDGWVRVVGMMLLLLGWMDVRAARAELREFFRITVEARLAVPLFFGAFVALGWAKPLLLAFAAVDVAGAAWTAHALRRSREMPRTNGAPQVSG